MAIRRLALPFVAAISMLHAIAGQSTALLQKAGEVSEESVQQDLFAELAARLRPGAEDQRFAQLEDDLRSMYAALPKNANDRLEHSVVRYALHRFLVQRHGWFIKGLEPDGNARNAASPMQAMTEWVPSYLQEVMEKRSASNGYDLNEFTVLAATLEDIVHSESVERLQAIYKILDIPSDAQVDEEQAEHIIDMYLMVYLLGGDFSANSPHEALLQLGRFKRTYEGWRDVERWARNLVSNMSALGSQVDFAAASRAVEEIGLHFGSFNDVECEELKSTLVGIEAQKQGRVRLSTFYNMGLHTHWSFTEKIDYLRALGALDESDAGEPYVIVPNYLSSRPQCLEASKFYAVCCRNECEDLMGHLEEKVAGPLATPEKIVELVSDLSSDTIVAPRDLSAKLIEKLHQIAATHGGRVPLHGRLFAQWMHHAFPRECPFPHESGSTSPQTPDEWMRNTGHNSTQASEDEMVCHVNGPCAGGNDETALDKDDVTELPWSDAEELLVDLYSGDRSIVVAASEESALPVELHYNAGQSTIVLQTAGEVSEETVQNNLFAELAAKRRPGTQDQRFAQLESELRSMYSALPKNSEDRLDHSVARYALHRMLVQRHGWFVKGLEPDGDSPKASSPAQAVKEWVPSYLQEVLEKLTASSGYDLNELVAFAATLEDIVHSESIERLRAIYKILEIPSDAQVDEEQAEHVIDMYLMAYLLGGEFSASSPHEALLQLGRFKRTYDGWRDVQQWARKLLSNLSDLNGQMDFAATSRSIEEIGLHFGSFNEVECKELKSTLLGIEAQKQGRVRLSAFYKMGLHTHWSFTEKIDYLRALGALDESDAGEPYVIVPNYLSSRPQCLEASKFYAVCCRNECEDLMAHLEDKIAAPFATPEKIAELVSELASDTIVAPRNLSVKLVEKLHQIAATHGGRVPLHGRLFAQWMHHAFPRECPFPHESGSTSPQTPDEWMRNTGHSSTQASEDEMVCHVNGPCAGGNAEIALDKDAVTELPWSDAEELLVDLHSGERSTVVEASEKPTLPVEPASSREWPTLLAFDRLLRTVVLAGVAVGLVLVSKVALPSADRDAACPKKMQSKQNWVTTLTLFILPLLTVSMDYVIDFSSTNEFLACGLCWCLAAMLTIEMLRRGLFQKDAKKDSTKSSAHCASVHDDGCWV